MFLREIFYVIRSLLTQYEKRDKIVARQSRLLQEMVTYSYEKVPYYASDVRYDPARMNDDIATLPILTKQHLRTHPFEDFIAGGVDPRGCVSYYTSGTTGQRVRVLHDHDTHEYHEAAGVRRFLATRRYWPHYRLSHIRPFTPPKRFFEQFGLFRRHVIPANLSAEEIKARLLANKSKVLVGYPVYLRDLLRSLSKEELVVLRRRLRVIFSESELLIDEHRRMLEQGFGVPIFDDYSAFEVLSVSFECSHQRKHIVEDRVYVEVVDDNGTVVADGQDGNIIVTSFMERAMPLIRYSLGDKGYIEKDLCPCGRTFKTMKLTAGRSEDVVVLPDGKKLYCANFLHLAAMLVHVDECFVVQQEDGLVNFYFIPNTENPLYIEQTQQEIKETLFQLAGQQFPLECVQGDKVPFTRGGKGKFVTSDFRVQSLP